VDSSPSCGLHETSATFDLDICYARDNKNLERLARALIEWRLAFGASPENIPWRSPAERLP
jgi:hypothetical protein